MGFANERVEACDRSSKVIKEDGASQNIEWRNGGQSENYALQPKMRMEMGGEKRKGEGEGEVRNVVFFFAALQVLETETSGVSVPLWSPDLQAGGRSKAGRPSAPFRGSIGGESHP